MAAQPGHLDRLLALLDPLLGSPSFIVESHHRPAAENGQGKTGPQNEPAWVKRCTAEVRFRIEVNALG